MRFLIASLAAALLTGCASFDQARLRSAAETAVACAPSLALSRVLTVLCVANETTRKRRAHQVSEGM